LLASLLFVLLWLLLRLLVVSLLFIIYCCCHRLAFTFCTIFVYMKAATTRDQRHTHIRTYTHTRTGNADRHTDTRTQTRGNGNGQKNRARPPAATLDEHLTKCCQVIQLRASLTSLSLKNPSMLIMSARFKMAVF